MKSIFLYEIILEIIILDYLVIFISIYAPLSVMLSALVFPSHRYWRPVVVVVAVSDRDCIKSTIVGVTSVVYFGRAHMYLVLYFYSLHINDVIQFVIVNKL